MVHKKKEEENSNPSLLGITSMEQLNGRTGGYLNKRRPHRTAANRPPKHREDDTKGKLPELLEGSEIESPKGTRIKSAQKKKSKNYTKKGRN
jgi:hypothetical protein